MGFLRAHSIDVSVKDGKATLTGVVEEDVNKDLATQIVKGVQGIVTLTGKVDSGAEHALAVELAQNIRGVNSVEHGDLII